MKAIRRLLTTVTIPVLAIILGLLVSTVLVVMADKEPLETYATMFCEGFGPKGCQSFRDLILIDVEVDGVIETHFAPTYGARGHQLAIVLERATPLILTALAATMAFKAGMFSIGMDGQLSLGAVAAVFLGYALPNQIYAIAGIEDPSLAPEGLLLVMRVFVPLICIGAAMAVGAFYSWIAGILKVKLNVNELISTIILNAIAIQIVNYLVNFPLRSDFNNIARTHRIDDTAWLVPFNRGLFPDVEWFGGARMGIGFVIAIVVAVLIWFFLWRSTAGYEQRMTNGSKLFARFGGIPSEKAALRAMLISGALSGLAGSIMVLGVERRIVDGFATSGVGFDGLLVAVLARESIVGIFFVAVFFAGLTQGSMNLQFIGLPRQLGGMIIGFIILFSSMEQYFRDLFGKVRNRIAPRREQVTLTPVAPSDASTGEGN